MKNTEIIKRLIDAYKKISNLRREVQRLFIQTNEEKLDKAFDIIAIDMVKALIELREIIEELGKKAIFDNGVEIVKISKDNYITLHANCWDEIKTKKVKVADVLKKGYYIAGCHSVRDSSEDALRVYKIEGTTYIFQTVRLYSNRPVVDKEKIVRIIEVV